MMWIFFNRWVYRVLLQAMTVIFFAMKFIRNEKQWKKIRKSQTRIVAADVIFIKKNGRLLKCMFFFIIISFRRYGISGLEFCPFTLVFAKPSRKIISSCTQNEWDESYAVLMLLKRGAAWADFLPVRCNNMWHKNNVFACYMSALHQKKFNRYEIVVAPMRHGTWCGIAEKKKKREERNVRYIFPM